MQYESFLNVNLHWWYCIEITHMGQVAFLHLQNQARKMGDNRVYLENVAPDLFAQGANKTSQFSMLQPDCL